MKREFSAGGIVFKRSRDQEIKRSIVQWLIVQHSQHKGWVFPKGLIGDIKDGESKEETAVREVKEEGGVEAKIIAQLKNPIKYWYVLNKEKIAKTVYFYLMQYLRGDIRNHDYEVMDSKWLTKDEVKKTLTYKNDKKAFEEALKMFKKLKIYNSSRSSTG